MVMTSKSTSCRISEQVTLEALWLAPPIGKHRSAKFLASLPGCKTQLSSCAHAFFEVLDALLKLERNPCFVLT